MDGLLISHLLMELFLIGLIVFLSISHRTERRELLDRVMARDFPELVTHEIERKKATIPPKIVRQEGIPL